MVESDAIPNSRRHTSPALVFAITFTGILIFHLSLLRLPYFWDEAGYYIPAARDFFYSGTLIPHSTPSNAHPPLIMVFLAACWKVAGYSPMVTRVAMLSVSAFSLAGLFRLAETVANRRVAIATLACTAFYPVFFVQSSLAQVDLAAAGFTFWGLASYVRNRSAALAVWLTLAALSKETAILAPVSLLVWELIDAVVGDRLTLVRTEVIGRWRRCFALCVPAIVLSAWYGYHYQATGYLLGNPEYFRYNIQSTLSPLRFVLAFGLRLWQTFGYLHLWVLTGSMGLAMLLPPRNVARVPRQRISIPVQASFLVVAVAYIVFMSAVGGAVLARYMLPVVPLLILVAISTLWRRVRYWVPVLAIVLLSFGASIFWPPPYGFSLEDNLAYRDYIVMHQNAARFLQDRFPGARILTAWPASDELSRPYLGYVSRPLPVVRVEDFSAEQVLSVAEVRRSYDVALVFSTKYQPTHPLFARWQKWQDLKSRFFGYHRDLPPQAIAQIVGGNIDFMEAREGQWTAVISMERMEDANLAPAHEADIRWHECVFSTNHTSLPSFNPNAPCAASVR